MRDHSIRARDRTHSGTLPRTCIYASSPDQHPHHPPFSPISTPFPSRLPLYLSLPISLRPPSIRDLLTHPFASSTHSFISSSASSHQTSLKYPVVFIPPLHRDLIATFLTHLLYHLLSAYPYLLDASSSPSLLSSRTLPPAPNPTHSRTSRIPCLLWSFLPPLDSTTHSSSLPLFPIAFPPPLYPGPSSPRAFFSLRSSLRNLPPSVTPMKPYLSHGMSLPFIHARQTSADNGAFGSFILTTAIWGREATSLL